MEQVAFTAFAYRRLSGMTAMLLAKNYFSFLADADAYVNTLVDFIYTIPGQKHRATVLPKYGKFYARYKQNKHTTYYITFDKIDEKYLIKKHHYQPHPAISALYKRHEVEQVFNLSKHTTL
jgi:hypothetical protein